MLFTSKTYWLLFLGVFVLFWSIKNRRKRNTLLLIASYLFYGWIQWKLLGLIVLSSLIDWHCSQKIYRNPESGLRWVKLSVISNLGILGLFKYHEFFVQEVNRLLSMSGTGTSLPFLELLLPVGISFYTFQSMSYTIDVYRKRIAAPDHLADFLLYVSFFPQLVAGPIERGERLMPQFKTDRIWDSNRAVEGLNLIVWGLFRKLVLADNLALVVKNTFDPLQMDHVSAPLMLLGIYAFSLQIYCDFVAYSDIARGCGRLLGFDLSINFRAPYLASSPQDFWRRWHITLSQWLRDYLYIPLGGRSSSVIGRCRNLMIVMFLGGLWHGASWIFVIWGLYHGALLVLHQIATTALPALKKLPRSVKQLITFHAVAFGFMIFRSASVDRIIRNCELLLQNWNPADFISTEGRWILFSVIALCLIRFNKQDRLNMAAWPIWSRAVFYVCIWYSITLLGATTNEPFIYFQF